MTRAERLAYLAGIVDGEGTIRIARVRSRSNGKLSANGGFRYQPQLLVVNTDRALLEAVQDIAGCGIIYQGTNDRNGNIPDNWSPVFRFQICAQQARAVITEIRPYLIAKARHADVVLAMPTRTRNRFDRSALPAQEKAFALMADLNRRGRKTPAIR